MDMAHLRPEARELALLPAAERLALLLANRWIGYTRATEAITLLDRLLASTTQDGERTQLVLLLAARVLPGPARSSSLVGESL